MGDKAMQALRILLDGGSIQTPDGNWELGQDDDGHLVLSVQALMVTIGDGDMVEKEEIVLLPADLSLGAFIEAAERLSEDVLQSTGRHAETQHVLRFDEVG